MKQYPIYQVDAFTPRIFGGNPAAVVLLEEWLPDEQLQAVAAENNLSETAYLVRNDGGYHLRWFTPAAEVDLCGHATLAAAHVLFENNLHDAPVRFETLSGPLTVDRDGGLLVMDFPSRPPKAVDITQSQVAEALGAMPTRILGSRDLLVTFEDEQAVRELKPDFALVERIPFLGVIATAPGVSCDFVSRFFCPRVGIQEDPVTGSAHCTLVPYWAEQLQRNTLRAKQLSKRVGELYCELRGDRVAIAGRAMTYMQGQIHLP